MQLFYNLILSLLNWLDKKSNNKLQNILELNTLPKLKNNYFERREEQEIIQKVLKSNIIQIFGISGIGKSELAKTIAITLKKLIFTKIIWVMGDDLKNTRNYINPFPISLIRQEFCITKTSTQVSPNLFLRITTQNITLILG